MLISVVIVLVLVIAAIVLTQVLPRGEYERVPDESGNMQIVPGTYAEDDSLPSLKWWQAVFAPFLVLDPTMDGSLMVWALIALLLVIGAVFTALDHTGVLIYMVEALRNKFRTRRYALLFILPLAFMFLGSSAGMFEELIPLVPVVVLLCYAFGWDALVGLAISVLAACFGFTAGVVNPFTVGAHIRRRLRHTHGVRLPLRPKDREKTATLARLPRRHPQKTRLRLLERRIRPR